MMFCLDDGAELLYGPASTDEPATAILSADRVSSEQATRTFGQNSEVGGPPAAGAGKVASKRNSIIAGIVGVALVTALGIGSYLFYGGKGGRIDSIAVLPFENRSGNADTDYLSDGLAESLIYRLSHLLSLKVSPVSSVIRYKGKEVDAKRIAAELGVGAVMSGRMTQRGENLTISVELIDAANNEILWGEQYDRKMSDLLATQREIATTITAKAAGET